MTKGHRGQNNLICDSWTLFKVLHLANCMLLFAFIGILIPYLEHWWLASSQSELTVILFLLCVASRRWPAVPRTCWLSACCVPPGSLAWTLRWAALRGSGSPSVTAVLTPPSSLSETTWCAWCLVEWSESPGVHHIPRQRPGLSFPRKISNEMCVLLSGTQQERRCIDWLCRPESSTFAETRQPATFAQRRWEWKEQDWLPSLLANDRQTNRVVLMCLAWPLPPRLCSPTWRPCLHCITARRGSNTSPRGHTVLLWSWQKVKNVYIFFVSS